MGKGKLILNNITDQEKWATINYEVNLYLSLYQEMDRTILTDADLQIRRTPIIRRALLESKGIHVRNLCEIFTRLKSSGDIVLVDLVSASWFDKYQALITNLINIYNPLGVDSSPKNILDKF